MIGYLRGKIRIKQPPILLLDVQGVGYELEAPMPTFYNLPEEGAETALHVHMVVREDAQLLFGFSDHGQRELFKSLLKVNGVGPRVGLAILSTLDTQKIINCIQLQDSTTLTRVPGIGKKTAERLILDLRDRIESAISFNRDTTSSIRVAEVENPAQDAIGALVALGYKRPEAVRAVNSVKEENEMRDDLIKNALQFLSRK